MADIAQIGFRADTSDLDATKQKLDALPAAAAKVERATDKLNASMDKSAEAAANAATASAKLEAQVNKTAAATDKAATTNLRSLKEEAAARLAAERAAGKTYNSGIANRDGLAPGARKNNGGIIPNYNQDVNAAIAGLDKLAGKTQQAAAANDNFEKGMEDTGKAATKAGSAVSGVTDTIGRFARGLIAAFAVNKLVDFAQKSVTELVALGDTSKRTGIELERLQKLQYAGVSQGLNRDQFNSGVEGLAEKLNEARHVENDLSKLFDDNNIKLKDRKGEVISTNDALMKASGLIQNAATEFDKIKIAEALGLTREWIPLLEQGPDAINKMAEAAGGLGTIFDREAIEKARKFNEEWSTAVDRWVQMFKQAAIAVLGFLDWIIGKASGLFGMLDRYAKQVIANEDIKNNGASGMSRSTVDYLINRAKEENSQVDQAVLDRRDALNELDRENKRFAKIAVDADPSNPLNVTVRPRGGKATDVSSLFDKGGGGGGSGKTDQEKYDDIVTRAEANLAKLTAQRDAIGLTAEAAAKLKYETELLNQAKRADIELTDTQREKLMGLASQMATTEVETKQLKEALDFGKDLTKGFLQDFLQGVKNGESVFKSFGNAALGVLNKIADKLISMAVDSLFSKGSGGFGGILGSLGKLIFGGGSALGNVFGQSGHVSQYAKGGAFTNGIYGSPTLFQFASGGKFGVMGEAGPEAVMPLSRGPDGSLGVEMHGGSAAPTVNDVNVTNVYRIEGAVSEEKIVATIKATAERTTQDVKRNLVPWINQYNQDGAIV